MQYQHTHGLQLLVSSGHHQMDTLAASHSAAVGICFTNGTYLRLLVRDCPVNCKMHSEQCPSTLLHANNQNRTPVCFIRTLAPQSSAPRTVPAVLIRPLLPSWLWYVPNTWCSSPSQPLAHSTILCPLLSYPHHLFARYLAWLASTKRSTRHPPISLITSTTQWLKSSTVIVPLVKRFDLKMSKLQFLSPTLFGPPSDQLVLTR